MGSFERFARHHVQLGMGDYAFFEYRAKVSPASHAEEEGEPVHCLIRMKIVTDHGRYQRNVVELEQAACDLVLFTLHPGPYRNAVPKLGAGLVGQFWGLNTGRILQPLL